MRPTLLLALALRLGAAELDPADRAYGEGLAAYERAATADALRDAKTAKAELAAARAQLARAIEGYRARKDADARRRQADAAAVGKVCCGRASLWRRYDVPAPDEPAR